MRCKLVPTKLNPVPCPPTYGVTNVTQSTAVTQIGHSGPNLPNIGRSLAENWPRFLNIGRLPEPGGCRATPGSPPGRRPGGVSGASACPASAPPGETRCASWCPPVAGGGGDGEWEGGGSCGAGAAAADAGAHAGGTRRARSHEPQSVSTRGRPRPQLGPTARGPAGSPAHAAARCRATPRSAQPSALAAWAP